MPIKHYSEVFEELEKKQAEKGEDSTTPPVQSEEMVEVKTFKGKTILLSKSEYDRINNFTYRALNKEERTVYVAKKKADIKEYTRDYERWPEQSPERRQAARENMIALNKELADRDERMRKRRITRYLKDITTGRVFAWIKAYADQPERFKDLGWHDPKHEDISKL